MSAQNEFVNWTMHVEIKYGEGATAQNVAADNYRGYWQEGIYPFHDYPPRQFVFGSHTPLYKPYSIRPMYRRSWVKVEKRTHEKSVKAWDIAAQYGHGR